MFLYTAYFIPDSPLGRCRFIIINIQDSSLANLDVQQKLTKGYIRLKTLQLFLHNSKLTEDDKKEKKTEEKEARLASKPKSK